MLKAYAIGFFGAVLAIGLAAAIWLAAQPEQKPSLVWGTTTYTSKEQFNGYLKSKGLTYKTWLARNPGVAPWEPAPRAEVKAATHTDTRGGRTTWQVVEDWVTGLPLMALAAILATGAALTFLRRRPPRSLRARNIGAGDIAFSLLAVTTFGLFVLFVAVLVLS